MEKQTQTQKQNNADKLEDISIEIKSILRQTSEIRSDLSYIKAYLDIKAKQKPVTDTTGGGSWWWG
jgi:hypothetical protein|tara:strand:+ start:672 stop:869 length:198 start_codon:yes stop_codon:yes gene_type:complete